MFIVFYSIWINKFGILFNFYNTKVKLVNANFSFKTSTQDINNF